MVRQPPPEEGRHQPEEPGDANDRGGLCWQSEEGRPVRAANSDLGLGADQAPAPARSGSSRITMKRPPTSGASVAPSGPRPRGPPGCGISQFRLPLGRLLLDFPAREPQEMGLQQLLLDRQAHGGQPASTSRRATSSGRSRARGSSSSRPWPARTGANPLDGSSSTRTSGACSSALVSPSLWRLPRESVLARRSAWGDRPRRSIASEVASTRERRRGSDRSQGSRAPSAPGRPRRSRRGVQPRTRERRANAARDRLITLGVPGTRLKMASYGKEGAGLCAT
jgi:hypothetical protein